MNEELDLKEIVKLIYQRKKIIIAIVTIITILGMLYTFIIKRPTYKVTAQILIDKADASIEQVITSKEIIQDEIEATFDKTSKIIKVNTEMSNKDEALNTINQYIEKLQSKLKEVYEIKKFQIIETPELPQQASNENYIKDILIAICVGIFIDGSYMLIALNFKGLTNIFEIEEYLKIKALGIVNFDNNKKQKQDVYISENESIQYELKRIQQEVGITFIYVTHDQEEALTMSDKIVIMKGGEIQQVGTPQEIYNEPVNKYVANFIGESNVISGIMVEDYKVKFDDQIFDCVDFGFKPNEKVDVVLRPEDIDIVPLEQGKITGEVLSVLFKGVWNEAMVETVPGTTVKVNMNVIKNHDVESEYSDERISANDFYVDIEEVASLDDNDLIARADAQAWKESDDSYISISKIEHNLKEELGEYTVTFQTSSGLSVSRKIIVVDQKYVKNEKANEAVSAFNFFKTVDEIKESVALDTDLKTWANAIGWKLSNEDEAVDIYVDYDFDPENIKEGIYQVTFSTEGRELKVHTTDYVEEGQEVGLTFEVEDIHVMEKMGF